VTSGDDERRLVEAVQGDPAQFVEIYDRYFHRVWAYVIRRTGNHADAEDVTMSRQMNMLARALLSEEVQRRRLHAFLYDCEAGLFEQRPPSRRIRTRRCGVNSNCGA
jgi:DNA-directed RNA polymerase specialized sigma24 family protein